MYHYYQPWILPFLSRHQTSSLPRGLKSLYYHSFEDGLWQLLAEKFAGRRGLVFLVPDFYCSDVLDNIRLRGHEYIYYPLDEDFQISSSAFRRYLWLYRPDVVIVFHACGITSRLMVDISWLPDFPAGSLLIEDSVHRLVDPGRIQLIAPSHVVMDSLRKVSPFPGSRLIGSAAYLDFSVSRQSVLSWYSLRSLFYFILFRLTFITGFIFHSSRLIIFAHDRILARHDDIIGDNLVAQPGLPFMSLFISRLDYSRFNKLKESQVVLYDQVLAPLFGRYPRLYRVNIDPSDYGRMHVYPLGFRCPPRPEIISYFHSLGIPVWFKFTDSPWSLHRSVLFLPLGYHISHKQIRRVSGLLTRSPLP